MVRYLETFFRNRWIVSIPALLLLMSGSILIFTVQRTYTASARIWAERSTYLDVPIGGNQYLTPAQIQAGRLREFISSDTFSRAIVDRTSLGASGTEDEKWELADAVQNETQIWDAGEHSVQIGFAHRDPELALQIVKLAVEQYNDVSSASDGSQASSAIKFYQDRIKLYEEKQLPEAAEAVQSYLESHPEVRRDLEENGPRDSQFTMLQQALERDLQQYQQYRQRLDEVTLQSDATRNYREMAFRFIDPPALEAGGGVHSKKKLLMFAGAGTAVSLAYVALFLLLATELDSTMRNAGDISRRLRIPVLEVIPDYTERRSIASRLLRPRRRQQLVRPVRTSS